MTDVRLLLPLRPVVFEILLALNEAPTHGYGLMKTLKQRSAGRWILGPGTLYRTLREMQTQDLIEPLPGAEDGRGRRDYRLTARGRRVAAAEARRMEGLVRVARAGQLLPGA